VGIFFAFFTVSAVWAQGMSFRVEDSKIRLSVAPGSSQAGTIRLYSQSDTEIHLRVYLEDWKYEEKQDGSKNFFPAQSTPLSGAGWIKFNPGEITLPAYGVGSINYIVNVPQEATGGYYAVMFFETLLSTPVQSEGIGIDSDEVRSGIDLALRIGSLFYIEVKDTIKRVAGLKNLSVSKDEEDKPLFIAVDLQNSGNVDITADGTFHIMDKKGMVYARGEFNKIYTFPGDTARLTSSWGEPLSKGRYDLILTIDLGKALEEAEMGRGPVITQEAEIEIDIDGQVIRVGELR